MSEASTLTPADLDRLADRIGERLANQPRLVDRVTLARRFGISVPTIERYTRAGTIPCVRLGRRVLYAPDAVLQALTVAATDSGEGDQ